jgi:hypothetical protein
MNFLALCQRLRQECGISGSGPATVVSQTGNLKRIVDWTNTAWMDIQTTHQDWDWMRTSASFTTVTSQATYALGTGTGQVGVSTATFGKWARDTFRNYVTSVGTRSEVFMDYIHYDTWRDSYMYGALRNTTTRPLQMTIAPDKSVCLGPPPIAGYTITGDYFTAPYEMSADADIPSLPTQFHMAIIYRAMMAYGAYESAPEVYQRGELEFGKLMRRMTADRVPESTWGGALC